MLGAESKMKPSKCSPTQYRNIQDSTLKECEPENYKTVSRTYPIFFQYGEYSVRLSNLDKQDVQQIQNALRPLGIKLVHKGADL